MLKLAVGAYIAYTDGSAPYRLVFAPFWIVLFSAKPSTGMLYAPAAKPYRNVPAFLLTIRKALLMSVRLPRSAPLAVSKLPEAFTPLVYAEKRLNTPSTVSGPKVRLVDEGDGDGLGEGDAGDALPLPLDTGVCVAAGVAVA